MEKLNCGNLLTLHRVYSEFFFNLNPSLYAVELREARAVFPTPPPGRASPDSTQSLDLAPTTGIQSTSTEDDSEDVMTPPMVGPTWPRVRSTLGSDCLPALSQGTASLCLACGLTSHKPSLLLRASDVS